ncbi:ATP-binding cassette domain-containing protein [Spiroplasma floricola]|uniref:ABC transporter ATP-binding protein n=1 Tax=Spiroplasma floricola 23-6 TaxID=1336749 RepID=A0A2K8SDN0_9MOLU|nr:ATP-binding cassette domain-containing protein [Spiroplasma floricola]AUB31566.1 ABC transporter ATP-binding protein [Spiroplasma floricola 23-6]
MLQIIKLNNISKKFDNKQVLKDINIEIQNNKIYGLLGNNGVGKTTLVKLIFNELNYDTGEIIYFKDNKQSEIDYGEWYYFLKSGNLPQEIKVKAYIEYIKNLNNISKKSFEAKYNEVIKLIDVSAWLKLKVADLSAGQKKILLLFICLILKPKVLFLDEPTANVDIQTKKMMIETIEALKKTRNHYSCYYTFSRWSRAHFGSYIYSWRGSY